MQDQSLYSQLKPQFPDQEHLKCPRCDSANTKFCYYNNYNLSQPRHFCKNCRRYWTKGGALRNIPVGGGTRKSNKRVSSKRATSSATTRAASPPPQAPAVSSSPPHAPPLVLSSSPTTSTTPPATVPVTAPVEITATSKGEPFPAPIPAPDFGNYGSILTAGEGQYGHFYDESNLQLYGSADPGSGQAGENPDEFLNAHHQQHQQQGDNGEAGMWNSGANWPDLSIYTPGSNFH